MLAFSVVYLFSKMDLADTIFLYESRRSLGQEDEASKDIIMKAIKDNFMAPLYTQLAEKFSWTTDEELLTSMK